MSSSMGRMTSHLYEMDNKTCSKPPTSDGTHEISGPGSPGSPSCYGYSFFNQNQVFVLIAFLYEDLVAQGQGLGLSGYLLTLCCVGPPKVEILWWTICRVTHVFAPQSTKIVEVYGYNPCRKVQQFDRVKTTATWQRWVWHGTLHKSQASTFKHVHVHHNFEHCT